MSNPLEKLAPALSLLGSELQVLPASGGAIVFKPGTNFDTNKVRNPYRAKEFSVRRTQESGSNEIRQSNPNNRFPW